MRLFFGNSINVFDPKDEDPMAATIYNVCRNFVYACTFSDPASKESQQWKNRQVEIILLKNQQPLPQKLSWSNRFFKAITHLTELMQNSIFLYRHGSFKLAEKTLRIKENPQTYRSICQAPTLTGNLVFITDPNLIRSVLYHDRNETGSKAIFSGGIPTAASRRILGENLLSCPTEEHLKLRKLISPHFMNIASISDQLHDILKMEILAWDLGSQASEEIFSKLPCLIVKAVCLCFFKYEGPFKAITEATDTLLYIASKKYKSRMEQRKYAHAIRLLDACANTVYSEYESNALLRVIPQQQIKAFVKLMFFAGQDTTSALIEYLILTLGQPSSIRWQESLYQQWISSKQSLVQFAQESPDLDDLIKEGLRLHPPSFEQTRSTQQDVVIDGTVVSAGSELHLVHLCAQRDVRCWGKDAQVFNPLRHREKNMQHVMFPFSMGPTTCLGKPFSILLLKLYLMLFISEYEWISKTQLNSLRGTIALKIEPDVRIQVKKRTAPTERL